jgi:hypothetical protein
MNMKSFSRIASSAALLLAVSAGTQAASLIVNGSFESTPQASGTWAVYNSISGWTTTFGPGIEIRNNVAGTAQDGNNFVELDSHPSPGNSWMAQTFNSPGATLDVSYWYAARSGTGPNTNGIEVWLNGLNVGGMFSPGDTGLGSNNTAWTLYTATLLGVTGSNTLEFRAVGTPDTLGGSLDNVTVEAVPLPGSLGLLGAGLAALGFARRRRAS